MRQSLFLEALFIIGLLATWEAYALDCPGGVIPPGLTLGVNDVSDGQALFWLNVGRARFGYKPNHYYKLGITTLDTDFPFSEAVLTLQEEDPSRGCGTGHFKFDTPHLYQFKDCQEVLLTNKKTPMTELPPVMWRAPECGCVLVNATVISNGTTYYMDQTPSGFLSKRLCPRQNLHVFRTKYTRSVKTEQPTTTTTTASTTQTPPQKKKLSRPERMDLLCQISLHFNGAELLAREVFLRRRQITRLNLTSLMRTELALDQRKLDIHECCKIVSTTKKTRCFDDMRRRRIDRYCRTGHPDVPFTARRDVFMGEKEERCCWRLGEPRYQCFAHNSIFKTVKGKNSVDYSFDEMDPVNDIGDYPSEIREVEMQHNTDYFIDDATQEVVIRGRETVTYTMSTGPSSSTTMASTTSEARDKGTSKTHTTRKSDQAESSTYSSVLSDVPRRQAIDVKTPVAAISAVDAELDALRKRKRKLDLKLTCCRHGKDAGEVFEVETGLYNHCRHQWKIYRRSLKTGKNMCMNKFMECCVDEAGILKNHDVTISKTFYCDIRIPSNHDTHSTNIRHSRNIESKLFHTMQDLIQQVKKYKMKEMPHLNNNVLTISPILISTNISKMPTKQNPPDRTKNIVRDDVSEIDVDVYKTIETNMIPALNHETKVSPSFTRDTMVTPDSTPDRIIIQPMQHILDPQHKQPRRTFRIAAIRLRRLRKRHRQDYY
ncbi:uncharacterized protein LOC124116410 isoform X1 [Haliotis rufescens]|uniref:uncharacterized protein LOC124116410 isoform X1 n=1 Tax=Haliotis rufescens TaxID=6454 RepID=UPI00201EA4C8|nr:uncharacterized protein LOC124116410 isoform X1 [Haliotis rufescens]